ncbi:MAG: DUF5127 domain-containing protein, partial [Chitinophaga rupis]
MPNKRAIVFSGLFFIALHLFSQVSKMPAYPLINHDTYFSIWSFSDTLTNGSTKHWTGADQPLLGFLKVDGKAYRFLGKEDPGGLQARQRSVNVTATQTSYHFTCGGIDLELRFINPLLIKNIDELAKPISYISFKLRSNDGKQHKAVLYFGASSNMAVNKPEQTVTAAKYDEGELHIVKAGTTEQPVLQKRGDDLRIDWGYMYVAAPKMPGSVQSLASSFNIATVFNGSGIKQLTGKT